MSKNKLSFEDFREALFKKDDAYKSYRTRELQRMYDNDHALSFADHPSPAAPGAPPFASASVERKGEESAHEFIEKCSGLPTQTEKLLQTIISNQQKQLQTLVGIRWGIIGFAIWFVVEFIILRKR